MYMRNKRTVNGYTFKLKKFCYKKKVSKVYKENPEEFLNIYKAAVKLRNMLKKELNNDLIEVVVTRKNNIKILIKYV